MPIMIYGAKSLALGACKALQELYPDEKIGGFIVSSADGNASELNGLPVMEISSFANGLTDEEKSKITVWIGTPEDVHPAIIETLKKYGFENIVCMDSHREAKLMEKYFAEIGCFPSVHSLCTGAETPSVKVYMIKFFKDVALSENAVIPEWVQQIQVGADLTDIRVAEQLDNEGENISAKNRNYCETTAFYWLWKNKLCLPDDNTDYYGFYHYRRVLDINEEDLRRMKANDIDVVVQFPTLHEPDIKEHHSRYVREEDWEVMLEVMGELFPEYRKAYDTIFSQEYFYNYNLIIARPQVLKDYFEWLFAILEATEQRSIPKGSERSDRYLAYMSESLFTLYFLYNSDRLKICHTGRFMFT